ncbi:MAG: restriction endonuclease subunit S [Victivallaceae bacterium]|nr:restriction endonuclease subunit S [Victivallaceae bacterium]
MSEWKEYRLSEVLDLISGFAFKSKNFLEYQKEGSLPVIKIKNVANGDVNLEKVVYHQYDNSLEKYKLAFGDVLIAMTGNHPQAITQVVGDVSKYKLKTEALLNQRVGKIITKGENDLNFFYYFFKDEETHRYLANNSSGSANQANISKNDILGLISEIPEPTEQRAIAEVLSSLDDKIDLLHRQNKTLEQMAKTLFRQWFVEEAKEDWEERPLSSIANFLNGLACQKYPPKNDVDKLPVLKIKQLRNGFSEDCDWCTTDVKPEYLIKNGDIIFSWSASLMVKIWDGEACILNQHLFKVTSDEFPQWYYYLWSKHHLDEFISISASHATTMGHIKRGDLDNAMVLVPSDDEMIELSEIQTPIIDKIISNNKHFKKLVLMRETLLPKLVSGEIKVLLDE